MINRIVAIFLIMSAAVGGALTLAPLKAEFAQQGSYGGVSTGSANAQVISLPGVAVLSQLRGVSVTFTVGTGLTDTGPTTLGINGISPVNVERMNSGSLSPLAGGEMPAAKMVRAFYDGTEFVLETNYAAGVPTGQVAYFDAASCPPGWAAANGTSGTVNVVGQFIRALNTGGSGFDPGRTLASAQGNSVQGLGWSGSWTETSGSGSATTTLESGFSVGSAGTITETSGAGQTAPGGAFTINTGNNTTWLTAINSISVAGSVSGSVTGTGSETRPQNVALLACQAS